MINLDKPENDLRLTRVKVDRLFDVFNHDIALDGDTGITIIIGENGLGKTVILEAIKAFFDRKHVFFEDLSFDKFEFYFNNKEVWSLTKERKEDGVILYVSRDGPGKTSGKPQKIAKIGSIRKNAKSRRSWEVATRMDVHEYEYLMSKASKSEDMLSELRHLNNVRYFISEEDNKIIPPVWYVEGTSKINVKLIETQRILTAKDGGDSFVMTIQRCAENLTTDISEVMKRSADVTSSLDSSYPNRLIEKFRRGTKGTYSELNVALSKLDERRKSLAATGLVVDNKDYDLAKIDESQKDLIVLLKLYIDDSHEKLDPYDNLAQKIRLLMDIVNKRFKHKKIEINKDNGFQFRSTTNVNADGKYVVIPSTRLSSGEQHELVLFYKLIFESRSGDMILIDEPELSLHISWQNKFIKDLKQVASMNDVTVVIATHSPDIIDENWDLKVQLRGVE